MEVRCTFALLLIVASTLTLSASATPVICSPVAIDGHRRDCVINVEVSGDVFEKTDNLFDDDDNEEVELSDKSWTKNTLQDEVQPCSTSSNTPLGDQRLDTARSRVAKRSNSHSTLPKDQLGPVKRTSLREGLGDGLGNRELEEVAGKRSSHEISAILPPWKEFCRMLGRNGCGRYMRRQLSR